MIIMMIAMTGMMRWEDDGQEMEMWWQWCLQEEEVWFVSFLLSLSQSLSVPSFLVSAILSLSLSFSLSQKQWDLDSRFIHLLVKSGMTWNHSLASGICLRFRLVVIIIIILWCCPKRERYSHEKQNHRSRSRLTKHEEKGIPNILSCNSYNNP